MPHLPPRQIGSLLSIAYFYHPGIEVYYFDDNHDPRVCEGDNPSCSYEHNKEKDYDVCNHITYADVKYGHTLCSPIAGGHSLIYTLEQRKAEYKKALSFISALPKMMKKENRKNCTGKAQIPQLVCPEKSMESVDDDESFIGIQTFGDLSSEEEKEVFENIET